MIVVTVEKRYRMTTVRARVRTSSIERALQLVGGEDAHVVFPIDAEHFFAALDIQEGIEELSPVGNEEVLAA